MFISISYPGPSGGQQVVAGKDSGVMAFSVTAGILLLTVVSFVIVTPI